MDDFLCREVPDETHVCLLGRNRQDAANLFERRRQPILDVRMNDLIAASRMFLEPAPFPRVASR